MSSADVHSPLPPSHWSIQLV